MLHLLLRSKEISHLNQRNENNYQEYIFDLSALQEYSGQRDYLKSAINVLIRHGYCLQGAEMVLDSDIPIGKGMCSSSAMILALMKGLLSMGGITPDPLSLAEMAWEAEVREFNEPGGRMDHYASALTGLLHLDFSEEKTWIEPLQADFGGVFLLFDTLHPKDTLRALRSAKEPSLRGLSRLNTKGITGLPELIAHPLQKELLGSLPEAEERCLRGNISNRLLLQEALAMLRSGTIVDRRFGELLTAHHRNLADYLLLSTPELELIHATACAAGAWGGKLNGSGGGGCIFFYAPNEAAEEILTAVSKLGYPGRLLSIA